MKDIFHVLYLDHFLSPVLYISVKGEEETMPGAHAVTRFQVCFICCRKHKIKSEKAY